MKYIYLSQFTAERIEHVIKLASDPVAWLAGK